MSGETTKDTGLSDREQHILGYFQACDNMINDLGIKNVIFTSLHKLFDFFQPNNLKTIGDKELNLNTAN